MMKLRAKRSNMFQSKAYIAGQVYEVEDDQAERMLKLWEQVGAQIIHLFEDATEGGEPETEEEESPPNSNEGSPPDSNKGRFGGKVTIGKVPEKEADDGDEAEETEDDEEEAEPAE
jgi:hypothetical protein